MFVSAVAKSDF